MKKGGFAVIAICVLVLASTMTVMGAEWRQDAKGWWYQKDDGTYPVNTWEWIDGNGDGVAESYCFDESGYLYTNITTQDDFQVNQAGAWVVNGIVQTKMMQTEGASSSQGEVTSNVGRGEASTTEINSQYVIKRINIRSSNNVEGGRMMKYDDFTGWKTFNSDDIRKKGIANNYAVDGELFCPGIIDIPECVLVEIQLEGNMVVKATPIWIDNGERDYGGFSNKEEYIVGKQEQRREWRKYEYSNPEYAKQLKQELTEEAKQRAYEIYPDMIVDYAR